MLKYLQEKAKEFRNSNMCSLVDNEHIYCFIDSDHQDVFRYDVSELENLLRNLLGFEKIWIKMYDMASYIRIDTCLNIINKFIEMEV